MQMLQTSGVTVPCISHLWKLMVIYGLHHIPQRNRYILERHLHDWKCFICQKCKGECENFIKDFCTVKTLDTNHRFVIKKSKDIFKKKKWIILFCVDIVHRFSQMRIKPCAVCLIILLRWKGEGRWNISYQLYILY